MNITLVLDLDLHLFGHLVGQFRALRVEGREVLVADLRAADEVGGVRAGFQRRGAVLLQHPVELW